MAAHLKRQDPLDTVEDLSPGNPALRRQIALRYLIAGINIPASDIVVTNGALEALNLCLQAVTRPGDTVIVEAPTFYGALQALERQGLKALKCRRTRAPAWTWTRWKAPSRGTGPPPAG